MKLKFQPAQTIPGDVGYIEQDYAFDFKSSSELALANIPKASLGVSGTMQIEFDVDSGRLLYVWGYKPMRSWKVVNEVLNVPESQPGSILVSDFDEDIQQGVGYASDLLNSELKYFAQSKNVLIGDIREDQKFIRINSGTIIGFSQDALKSIILTLINAPDSMAQS